VGFVPTILLVRPLNRALYHKLIHTIVGAHARSAPRRPHAAARPDARAFRHPAALWCTVCLALPERINGVRVRVSGTVRTSLP
jgi:hypothetical protein